MPDQTHFFLDRFTTPIGTLIVVADEAGKLRVIDWEEYEGRPERFLTRRGAQVAFEARPNPFGLTHALESYFTGDIQSIDKLPVAAGGTAFQQNVWQCLRSIPAGETISYGTLAERLGQPRAVRAVGLANGANPVPIVVPCHRVIGSNGSLTGYGGGLDRKRWLLEHERRQRSLG
ncbi:MAG TPA: methylated-DNA--[protein]-cysteine S-methyltransferase [Bryobacteraceae bacterium]